MSDEIVNDAMDASENVESLDSELSLESNLEGDSSESSEVQAETQAELQDEISEAIENGASEEEVKSMIKSFELKVNGKTFTKELDLSDENAVKSELQKAYAGQQAMQKVRELEKSYEQALSELQSNPAKFLSEMGLDFDELSYNHLKSLNEQMQKSPEEQAREAMQRELEEARAEAQRLKEEKEAVEYERVYAEQQKALNDEIENALSAHKDLPPTQKTFQRIAETMLWAIENGFEDVKVEDVIPTVKTEIEKEMQTMFNDMPLEFYEKFIGKQNMEKLRQERLSRAKAAPEQVKVKETAVESQKEKKKDKVRAKDYFKNLGM